MNQEPDMPDDDVDFTVRDDSEHHRMKSRQAGWAKLLLALTVAIAIILGIIVGVQQSQIGTQQSQIEHLQTALDDVTSKYNDVKRRADECASNTTPTKGKSRQR